LSSGSQFNHGTGRSGQGAAVGLSGFKESVRRDDEQVLSERAVISGPLRAASMEIRISLIGTGGFGQPRFTGEGEGIKA
jgi:hypothetical protein